MKIYLIIAIGIMLGGAYFMGARITREKCKTEIANNQNANILNIIQIKENIDEKTFNTNTRDIRRILRDKYSIAE